MCCWLHVYGPVADPARVRGISFSVRVPLVFGIVITLTRCCMSVLCVVDYVVEIECRCRVYAHLRKP